MKFLAKIAIGFGATLMFFECVLDASYAIERSLLSVLEYQSKITMHTFEMSTVSSPD